MSEHREDLWNSPSSEGMFPDDDAFIDALSKGIDPSDGTDKLAGLLLTLRDEINAPVPPAPAVPEHLIRSSCDDKTTVFPVVAKEAASGAPTPVGDLDSRRKQRNSKHSGWFGHGLIGAAAATLIIAGGGALVHSAQPGDPLWGVNQVLFSDHAAVVELTATLEEADSRNAEGDVQGALKLLEQAKAMAQEMNAKDRAAAGPTPVVATETATVTATATKTVQQTLPPVTAVVTQTVTVTHTPTPPPSAPNLAPGVRPSTSVVKPPSFAPPTRIITDSLKAEKTTPIVPPRVDTEPSVAPTNPGARATGTQVSAPTVIVDPPAPAISGSGSTAQGHLPATPDGTQREADGENSPHSAPSTVTVG